ncbi:aminotransferase class I/II-fold pyridoxal phosphate-dependent enzyme [Hoeflea sp.]|uniref:aminotransferase class I/II-fold pyridoxal phosphate-dependent enzyme n=1 Tax=Hoeflea sp. TaxID=1940281 RepID=UPI003B01CD3F
MKADRFGNRIDESVGYARGKILASSADEIRRLRNAQSIAADVVSERGPQGIGIFTGNPRHFPLTPSDLESYCEEWVGPGLFADELSQVAIGHLGGNSDHATAVFNRTSAAIISAVLALSDGRPVVSYIPAGDRSHASVVRGCTLAGVALKEVEAIDALENALFQEKPALVVVTTVTSSLARLEDGDSRTAIEMAQHSGAIVFLDEAYGARLRPVLHGGEKSLHLGADLAVTNADKAGLSGPRAGVLVGRQDAVVSVQAKASELGQEARAPIAAGALRSLQRFDPEHLRQEARDGAIIADALEERFGHAIVRRSDLGPAIGEEDVLSDMLGRRDVAKTGIVPAEASAAVGMLLLRDLGVLTVSTHGAPGGRVSLRLKPTHGALDAIGGVAALASGLDRAFEQVSEKLDDPAWFSVLLFGGDA